MSDVLSQQLRQLGFAVVTGQHRLTDEQRQAIADLNAAAAVSATALTWPGVRGKVQLTLVTKEPA